MRRVKSGAPGYQWVYSLGISTSGGVGQVAYLHGLMARMELEKNQVQGVDYAYTLQGWLKGV